jgi:hypothetical protein
MTWNAGKPDMTGSDAFDDQIQWTRENIEHVKDAIYTGWNPALTSAEADQTWEYLSATSIRIDEGVDYSATYPVGTKVKFTQVTGGTKYAEVLSISYSENEAITNPYFTFLRQAQGYTDVVMTLLKEGWINPGALPTRTSGTSFTLLGDWTDRNQKGDKIWVVDGGTSKYAYLWGVSHAAGTTTFTTSPWATTAGASATFDANPTAYYFSKSNVAVGFPVELTLGTITYTTSGDPFTNSPTTTAAKFWMEGAVFYSRIQITCHATSGGTGNIRAAIAGLPTPAIGTGYVDGSGMVRTTGKACAVLYDHANARFLIYYADGSTPIANNNAIMITTFWAI